MSSSAAHQLAVPTPLSGVERPRTAAALPLAPRDIDDADRRRYERHLAEILAALGLDLDTPGTRDTPRRLLAALIDATEGYEGDPKLLTSFPTECRGGADCELAQIVEGPIEFEALCEHHALPFVGRAWLGYIAHEQILGISKLTRLVRVAARRFAVQERLTHQLADALAELTAAHGVAVYLEAEHLCTRVRGVREHGSLTRTTAYRGVFERDASLRAEFREVAGLGERGR
ncbi:MAG TPA: GTP cyclohydrolase I [Candidatus Limnocylindrales bacterium]